MTVGGCRRTSRRPPHNPNLPQIAGDNRPLLRRVPPPPSAAAPPPPSRLLMLELKRLMCRQQQEPRRRHKVRSRNGSIAMSKPRKDNSQRRKRIRFSGPNLPEVYQSEMNFDSVFGNTTQASQPQGFDDLWLLLRKEHR
ncbi:uncharacterized protein LOC112887260 isoform X2 [Panicum hallii]|uniref:uncharacterized protein LOC112887260 isoform X2 n=1 Tax=Panicum hallii TaxID=206008 RepID=UPI000DF4E601|nr:uncharacterized protein LOC112887260 isoform X2 [Panicum hallii]